MTAAPLRHTAISASAGSGKTFQLAHRYIALLARGVPPERICALTFARKAAGEMFEKIVERLCASAADPAEARLTGGRIGLPGLGTADGLRLLRRLADSVHRLPLGTLDGFVVRVLRSFPMELGIPPDFTLADEQSAAAAEVRALALEGVLFAPGADEAGADEFLEAFKQATFGQSEKSLQRRLEGFTEPFRRRFRGAPDPRAWGDPARIWGPAGCPWTALPPEDRERAARDMLAGTDWPDTARRNAEAFAGFAVGFDARSVWPTGKQPGGALAERLLASAAELAAGGAVIRFRRAEVRLEGGAALAAAALVGHVLGVEIHRALERTRGLFRVLSLYEDYYGAAVRQCGCLTFGDAQHLLAADGPDGAHTLTRRQDSPDRLFLDYRLDAQLDHWLLDEFQDTSDVQWGILANLVDEVLQDPTGTRTFFYVGDVKQAVYGWRGGNARLFGRVLDRYGSALEAKRLSESFRSSPPVMEAVNRLFGALPDGALPAAALARWRAGWKKHTSAPGRPPEGYFAHLEPAVSAGVKPGPKERHAVVAAVLRGLDPAARGLSVAVLVRRNAAGAAVVDHLRRSLPGLPVLHEGPAALLDNPVVALLAALLRWAAHPGDTLALRHVQMSPLAPQVFPDGTGAGAAARGILRETAERGFRGALSAWADRLAAVVPPDPFSRSRLDELLAAAGAFDAEGGTGIDRFLDLLDEAETRDVAQPGAVRVMTIHQAKGLDFDAVILPDLEDRGMQDVSGERLLAHDDPATDRPLWLLAAPRSEVVGADPALSGALEEERARAAFESLCVLYVALTRARRAVYAVSGYPGKMSTSVTPAALMKRIFTGRGNPEDGPVADWSGVACRVIAECGQRDWTSSLPAAPARPESGPAGPAVFPAGYAKRPAACARLERIQPSEAGHREAAARLFDPEHRDVLAFGTAVHAMFERVEWADDADVDAIVAAWEGTARASPGVRRDAPAQFRRAMAAPSLRSALGRPDAAGVTLWRERKFEVVLEEGWVSGVFDRVTLQRDAAGAVLCADLLDYKTNRVQTGEAVRAAAEGYRGQMELYRRALCRILDIEPSRVRTSLFFTVPGRLWPVA